MSEKTIREKVYRILSEKHSISGKELQEEYRKRYNEGLNYYTALNYKVGYRAGYETKHNSQEKVGKKMKKYFKYLRKKPDKRYKRALANKFNLSKGYADHVLSLFLQQEDVERSEKFKWVLEPLKEFINTMCLTGEGYAIRKEYLLEAFNTYLSEKGLEQIGLTLLTLLMHDLDYEDTIGYTGTVRYLGVTLTSQAAKEFLDDQIYHRFERAERIRKMRERKNISSEEACKFICCKPAQKFLKKIADKYFDKYSYRKIRKILIKVEEVCGVGKYIRPQIAVAVSIYIFSNLYLDGKLSQEYVCDIGNTNPTTLRQHLDHVMERVEFKKDPDAEYNFSLEPIEEGMQS